MWGERTGRVERVERVECSGGARRFSERTMRGLANTACCPFLYCCRRAYSARIAYAVARLSSCAAAGAFKANYAEKVRL